MSNNKLANLTHNFDFDVNDNVVSVNNDILESTIVGMQGRHQVYKIATIDTLTVDLDTANLVYQATVTTPTLIAFDVFATLVEYRPNESPIAIPYFNGLEVITNNDHKIQRWIGNGWEEFNTDNLTEGVNNLYYTDTRADARVQIGIDDVTIKLDADSDRLTQEILNRVNGDSDLNVRIDNLTTTDVTELDNLSDVDIRKVVTDYVAPTWSSTGRVTLYENGAAVNSENLSNQSGQAVLMYEFTTPATGDGTGIIQDAGGDESGWTVWQTSDNRLQTQVSHGSVATIATVEPSTRYQLVLRVTNTGSYSAYLNEVNDQYTTLGTSIYIGDFSTTWAGLNAGSAFAIASTYQPDTPSFAKDYSAFGGTPHLAYIWDDAVNATSLFTDGVAAAYTDLESDDELVYDGNVWRPTSFSKSINDLSDVNTLGHTVSEGSLLAWDGTEWSPTTLNDLTLTYTADSVDELPADAPRGSQGVVNTNHNTQFTGDAWDWETTNSTTKRFVTIQAVEGLDFNASELQDISNVYVYGSAVQAIAPTNAGFLQYTGSSMFSMLSLYVLAEPGFGVTSINLETTNGDGTWTPVTGTFTATPTAGPGDKLVSNFTIHSTPQVFYGYRIKFNTQAADNALNVWEVRPRFHQTEFVDLHDYYLKFDRWVQVGTY